MLEVSKSFIFLVIFFLFSSTASIIDIKQKKIPNWIVFPGLFILTVLRIIFFGDLLYILAIDIISGPLLLSIVFFLTHGKLGIGDIKFSALIGVFIGLQGIFFTIEFASIIGLMFAVAGMVIGAFNLKTEIPFAPFLTLGSFLSFLIFNSNL